MPAYGLGVTFRVSTMMVLRARLPAYPASPMPDYPPQASDRKGLAFLLWRGFLRWKGRQLVVHPGLADVRADDWNMSLRPWKKTDDRHLAKLVGEGMAVGRIAVSINRPLVYVREKMRALGLRAKRAQRQWLPPLSLRRHTEEAICKAIISSGSWEEAGRKLGGISGFSVKQWGRQHDVKPTQPRLPTGTYPKQVERNRMICRERKAGASLQAIADRVGVSRERVRQIVKKAGVR